jgi:hypothetical protein
MNKSVLKMNEKLKANGYKLDTWTSLRNCYDKEVATFHTDLLIAFFEETHAAPEQEPSHLYVPGRCSVMWDKGENDDNEIGG